MVVRVKRKDRMVERRKPVNITAEAVLIRLNTWVMYLGMPTGSDES